MQLIVFHLSFSSPSLWSATNDRAFTNNWKCYYIRQKHFSTVFFSSFSFSSNRCVAWALVYRLQCSNKINKEKHTLQTTKKVIFIMNRLKIKKHDDFQSKIICAVSDFICRVEKGRREKPIFDWFICFEMKKKTKVHHHSYLFGCFE